MAFQCERIFSLLRPVGIVWGEVRESPLRSLRAPVSVDPAPPASLRRHAACPTVSVSPGDAVPYAIERYTRETRRLYGVLDKRLAGREYVAGEYSIADIASYPWIVPHRGHGQTLANFPNLHRWFETIRVRPATIRACEGVEDSYSKSGGGLSEEARKLLFGQGAASGGR